jgi:deoxyadenosine/deoxycytidine kinase
MQSSRPLVVEIVGPAGTGKTTLSEILNEQGGTIRAGITIWRQPILTVVVGAFTSLPTIISLVVNGKRFRISDLKRVAQLKALYRRITRMRREPRDVENKALIMDEGVVFALCQFRVNSSGATADPSDPEMKWENQMIDQWSRTLNTIVLLDGPDELLTERIRTREKDHRMKGRSEKEIVDFLGLYRRSYGEVISELRARGNINVVSFQTGEIAPARMAQEIFRLIG